MNFLGITSVRWFLFLQRERGDSNAEALRAETRLPADSKGKLTADLRENVITQRSDILTFTFSSLGKGHADPRQLINSQNPPSWSLLLLLSSSTQAFPMAALYSVSIVFTVQHLARLTCSDPPATHPSTAAACEPAPAAAAAPRTSTPTSSAGDGGKATAAPGGHGAAAASS